VQKLVGTRAISAVGRVFASVEASNSRRLIITCSNLKVPALLLLVRERYGR